MRKKKRGNIQREREREREIEREREENMKNYRKTKHVNNSEESARGKATADRGMFVQTASGRRGGRMCVWGEE